MGECITFLSQKKSGTKQKTICKKWKMDNSPKHSKLKVLPEPLLSPNLNDIGQLTLEEHCVHQSSGISLNWKTFVRRNRWKEVQDSWLATKSIYKLWYWSEGMCYPVRTMQRIQNLYFYLYCKTMTPINHCRSIKKKKKITKNKRSVEK